MRALICNSFDGVDSLQVGELPDPALRPGTARIEVEAAAVDFADILMVSGQYQLRPELPFVPGTEWSGVVAETMDLPGWEAGSRVCGFIPYGAMAQKVVAPGDAIIPVPEHISLQTAAAVPVAYGTSYHALVDRAGLHREETLLVLGAAGGVGLAAVQIGKVLEATVIAAVSTEEKAAAVAEAGADAVIRYDRTDLRESIAELTGGRGVDVVYDPVGGELTEQALRDTRWGGRLLVVGFASGKIPRIPLNLTLVKGNAVIGVFWGRFTEEEPRRSAANNRVIMDWVGTGRVRPLVQRTFPLEEAGDAMRWVAGRRAVGRVVVRL